VKQVVALETIQEVRELTESWRKGDFSIGLVPTMGFLHEGHVSLINKARQENDKVVVSVFVNPTQFGPNEDYDKYPKNQERDREICERAGVDLVFAPSVTEMYPSNNLAFVDITELGEELCGAKRPGHFRGVCTIVSKLFNIITPDRAYFGEKDRQQLIIIERMVKDLNYNIQIVPCPTVREEDGLAMSSRNAYLSEEERRAARVIPESLNLAYQTIAGGERKAAVIKDLINKKIKAEPLAEIDYIEVVDGSRLKPVTFINPPVVVAVAVYIGATRLIDNFLFKGDF
jgi:pantoate--beta-alanine ligase